ncbi:hypothetical protein [Streptomyces sp. NPDC005890]|uniref:hypothetical protein n=1 Tax=Streptomyces sp. NPDC005890 TaxID=3154568 RepID=UPI0033DFB8E1
MPDWNRVRLIVALCAERRRAGTALPSGVSLNTRRTAAGGACGDDGLHPAGGHGHGSGLPVQHHVAGRPDAAGLLDALLDGLDLPAVAARHPSALIAVRRAARPPGEGSGLFRPSDLPPLRAALPPGAYASEFAGVEGRWR